MLKLQQLVYFKSLVRKINTHKNINSNSVNNYHEHNELIDTQDLSCGKVTQ